MNRYQQKAVSLVQMLMALALLATLLSLATPSFSAYLQKTRQTTHIHGMLSALHFSRMEAVTRRTTVSLCEGVNECGTSRWRNQLIIFVDGNQNGQFDDGEWLIRTVPISPAYSWNWSNFRNRNHVSFRSNGMTHALNGTLTLCHNTKALSTIVINVAGRTRQESAGDDSRCE